MMPTTAGPAETRGSQTTAAVATPRELKLRTMTMFLNYSLSCDGTQQQEEWLDAGTRLMSLLAARRPAHISVATLRVVPPKLDLLLCKAKSRREAYEIASAQLKSRETLAERLNARLHEFGLLDTDWFVGGFTASCDAMPPYAFQGYLDAVEDHLANSKWQFGSAHLGGVDGVDEFGLQCVAHTISRLGVGGTRFCAMYGNIDFTPFCPCASHDGALEGIAAGMSDPDLLLEAIQGAADPAAAEEAVRAAQCTALQIAGAAGQELADMMGVAFLGVDPSQAPVCHESDPQSQSIGAVIQAMAGVPLGRPGTKDGFYRLMRGLRRAGSESGVRLCGFKNGSFLPVAEDAVVAMSVDAGELTYEGILDLCHICAAGLDMIVVPPETTPDTIARVLRDVAATHFIKGKALAVRLIVPKPDTPCDERGWYVFGGLLGSAPVLRIR